ncbi:PD40 domain-containing protein [Actinoplanes cyaneus]|uniref:PD40 domain-containing protein n=1 Tax=Actinoplanes cyaneus TaxID=52696 RepID=UPI001941C326|nr:PD40 domain-containing protein [Actinoplanes cyaneus]
MIEAVHRALLAAPVERLVAHPRLPLVAGVDATRPAVYVWDLHLRPVGTISADADSYGNLPPWERYEQVPELAWHPHEPMLLVTAGGVLWRWTPDGVTTWPTEYGSLAFSPDGGTVWASPASVGGEDAWLASDVVEHDASVVGGGPRWDTGVAEHPAGGLVLTLASDQGATLVLFARSEDRRMRIRSRALVLDADGYETPVWSPDGRRFAVRGNAYVQSLEVYSFPALERQVALTLREPAPASTPDWTEFALDWLRNDIAFGHDPDVLWMGTPEGALLALDLAAGTATTHPVGGAGVTALARMASGQLVVADRDGGLVLLSVPGAPVTPDADGVAGFLAGTEPIDATGYLWDELERTDGVRTWRDDDLARVVEANDDDPTWLRLQAAINQVRSDRTDQP